jgi:hypothetical protein
VLDDQPTGPRGALAVASSNPGILYVGSGEGLQRPDLSVGDGVYKLFERLGDAGSADLSSSPKDRTHFSEKGARAMARLVLEGLKATDTPLGPMIK